MMILIPLDASLNALIPSDLEPSIPNPLFEDIPLMQQIVSNHLVIREGVIPERVFQNREEYREIVKINMRGNNVIFHREDLKGGDSKLNAAKEERATSVY